MHLEIVHEYCGENLGVAALGKRPSKKHSISSVYRAEGIFKITDSDP